MIVKGYKAFNDDWTCRNKQYEVDKTYHEDNIELCEQGMHFCKELKDVFMYYDYVPTMKLAMVEASGTVIQSDRDSKCVTSDLKVVKELNVNSEAVQLEAVKENVDAIKYMDNPSEQLKLAAVKGNGWVIKFIDKPSEQLKLEAVKQNGWAIQFIDNPSEQLQLAAVKENGEAIQLIKKPSEKVQLEAVKETGLAIEYIDNPSEQVQLEAVKPCGWVIKFIDKPSDKVQLAAVKQNGETLLERPMMTNNNSKDSFIKNPFDAPRSKYKAFYKSLKAINDKNEAAFINKLVGMIISKKSRKHLTSAKGSEGKKE